jgi:glycosyltransferase involved in cell wall biosynthesis
MATRVLFVSKPIVPPFRDGTKCMVRDVSLNLQQCHPIVMSTPSAPALGELTAVELAPAYSNSGGFTPTLRENARAALWLLARSRADLWHFVFAPNPRTSQAARWLKRLRRIPVVQTVASPPRDFAPVEALLFGDIVVAQSRWTRDQFLAAGAAERGVRIEVIPPPVGVVQPRSEEAIRAQRHELGVPDGAPLFVYPGDLEVSSGAEAVATAATEVLKELPDAVFVFACRAKTPAAPSLGAALVRRLGLDRARFSSDPTDVLALMAGATAILFPVDDLWGKVDLPISLLEAMVLGAPVVVWDQGPLCDLQGAIRLPPGENSALVRTALELGRSSEFRSHVTAQQQNSVREHFSARRVAEQYEQLYRELA